MGRTAKRGRQHGTEEAAKLSPMVEVKQERSAPSAGRLEVIIRSPKQTMTPTSKAWPPRCFLEASFGGEQVARGTLPTEREIEKLELEEERNIEKLELEKEIKRWKIHLIMPVGLDWRSQSLDLTVKRLDYHPRTRGLGLQLIRGGPHTSRYDAVIGRARVKLMDALILGDEDEDEEGNDRKRRRHEKVQRMERTLLFHETVGLDDWVVPAPASAPRLMTRGTVEVIMGMFDGEPAWSR